MARILVVDDEAEVRLVVRRGLELAGHQVVEFDDGLAALQSPELGRADLILTDLLMPTPGAAFVQEVRRRGLQTPIIVMSGYLSHQDWSRIGEAGASAFVEKPVILAELGEVVQRLLS